MTLAKWRGLPGTTMAKNKKSEKFKKSIFLYPWKVKYPKMMEKFYVIYWYEQKSLSSRL